MKRIKKCLFAILALLILINIPVLVLAADAGENAEEEVYEEEYVVTATRIQQILGEVPGMTEMISGEEVEKGIDTVSEVLAGNGLAIATNGGESSFARPQLDGVNDLRLQFLVNGVPINPDQGGCVDLSYFPTPGLEKIEVVHGPLSALYGANALGGVLNIITDLTGEQKNNLSFGGGTFDSLRWGAAIQQEKWGLAVGGNNTDGHRIHSSTGGSYLSGQYDIFRNGEEYLILRGNYMSKDAQQPGSTIYGGLGKQEDQRMMTNLSGKTQWLDGIWEYKIYSQKNETNYKNYKYNSEDTHIVDNHGVDVAGLYTLANHELLVGSMFEVDTVDSTKSGKHSLDNFSLYLQDLWYVTSDILLLSGLRWDYNSEYGSPLSPRISITKYYSDDLNISLAYGEAFRAPSISDLYYDDGYYRGNPDLEPEKSKRFDIIGNWRRGEASFMLNIYRSLINDGIIITDDWTSMANIDKVKINGLNISMERPLGINLTGHLGYRWLEKMNLNRDTGEYVQSMEYGEHRWDLALKYKENNLTSTINWQMVSGRTSLEDYSLLNFSLKYLFNQSISLSLTANNLLDEEYEINSGYPMPGRSFSAGLSYAF